MGFIRGKQVVVVKSAPLRDPVEYRIMDSNVSLRRSEAGLIEVETGAHEFTNTGGLLPDYNLRQPSERTDGTQAWQGH